MKFLGAGADNDATTTPNRVVMMMDAETFMVKPSLGSGSSSARLFGGRRDKGYSRDAVSTTAGCCGMVERVKSLD